MADDDAEYTAAGEKVSGRERPLIVDETIRRLRRIDLTHDEAIELMAAVKLSDRLGPTADGSSYRRNPETGVLYVRADDFDPPLTEGQLVQMQEFINAGFADRDARDAEPVTSDEVGQAQEDPESRVMRAYANGFRDGLQRGSYGRFDHS